MFPKKKIFDKVFTREVIAGCSIPVVRVHGVDIDRVRFPAARHNEKNSRLSEFFSLCRDERMNCFIRVRESKMLNIPQRAEVGEVRYKKCTVNVMEDIPAARQHKKSPFLEVIFLLFSYFPTAAKPFQSSISSSGFSFLYFS